MKNHERFYLGIKGLIRNKEGEILLLLKNLSLIGNMQLAPDSQYWDIPGGRIEKGQTIEETLKREILEEIGSDKFLNRGFFHATVSNLYNKVEEMGLVLFIYDCPITEKFKVIMNDENVKYGWFDPTTAAGLLKFNYPKDFIDKLTDLGGQH